MAGRSLSLTIGIDLAKDYTQVSYLDSGNHVISMSMEEEIEEYQIPTLLFRYRDREAWCIGEEAKKRQKNGEGILIRNLLEEVEHGTETTIMGIRYFASDLLEQYFAELFKLIEYKLTFGIITNVVVTIPKLNKVLMDVIFDGITRIGIKKEQVKIISHVESFVYYVMNQKPEVRVNSVALFDFSPDGLTYMRMSVGAGRKPSVINVRTAEYTEEMNLEWTMDPEKKEVLEENFISIFEDLFKGNVVSSVFLTGEGFKLDWYAHAIQVLCSKRKGFIGDNLFAKGAGFFGREVFYTPVLGDYLLNCYGRTKVNVGIMVSNGIREVLQPLSSAGVNWYEGGARAECIADQVEELKFHLESPFTGVSKMITMKLTGLPKRPPKTTRLAISIAYSSDCKLVIQVEDKGFGDFFPSSGRIYREEINIEEGASV